MRERARIGLVWFACALVWAFFLVRVVVPAARNPNTNGFAAYYTESRVLLEDRRALPRLHDDVGLQPRIDEFFPDHVTDTIAGQPPAMSFILAPFAWLSPAQARAAWTIVSILLWIAGLGILIDALKIKTAGVPALPVLSALTTLYTPLTDNLRRGQAYILLYFLLCLAVRSLIRAPDGRRWAAGVPLGLMAVLKSAGLWLWPLLLFARRGRVVLATVATAGLVAVLSSPLFGWEMWRAYFLDSRWLASNPARQVTAYQTVVSLTGHLFVFEPVWNPKPVADLPRLALLLALLITTAALVRSVWLQRLARGGFEERALSLGLFVSLIVSLAPLAEGYHYVLVFPAVLIAFWWALRGQPRPSNLAVVIACTALIGAPQEYYGSPRLQDGWLALLAYPRLYGAFGLWAWLGNALRHAPLQRSPVVDGSSRLK